MKKLKYTIIFCAFAALISLCVTIIILFCNILLSPTSKQAPQTDDATQKTTRTTDLLSLQLSKEQVESSSFEGRPGGSILGNVGYVQGSSEGKPVTLSIGSSPGMMCAYVMTLHLTRLLRSRLML